MSYRGYVVEQLVTEDVAEQRERNRRAAKWRPRRQRAGLKGWAFSRNAAPVATDWTLATTFAPCEWRSPTKRSWTCPSTPMSTPWARRSPWHSADTGSTSRPAHSRLTTHMRFVLRASSISAPCSPRTLRRSRTCATVSAPPLLGADSKDPVTHQLTGDCGAAVPAMSRTRSRTMRNV